MVTRTLVMSAGVQHLFYVIFPRNAWLTSAIYYCLPEKSSMLKPAPFFLTGILVCNQIITIILKIEITIFWITNTFWKWRSDDKMLNDKGVYWFGSNYYNR